MSDFKQHRAIIAALICKRHGVSDQGLFGKRRTARLSKARFEAIWLLRRFTRLSTPALGRLVGGRDHTTVMNALSRIEAMMSFDASYADQLAVLAKEAERCLMMAGLYRREIDVTDVDALDAATVVVAASGARNDFEWRDFLAVSKAFLAAKDEIEAIRKAAGSIKIQAQEIEKGGMKRA